MQNKIDNQMWELQKICHRHDADNDSYRGQWTLWAVARYIDTGRASLEWTKKFISLDESQLQKIVDKSVKGESSDDATIKRINKLLGYKA